MVFNTKFNKNLQTDAGRNKDLTGGLSLLILHNFIFVFLLKSYTYFLSGNLLFTEQEVRGKFSSSLMEQAHAHFLHANRRNRSII